MSGAFFTHCLCFCRYEDEEEEEDEGEEESGEEDSSDDTSSSDEEAAAARYEEELGADEFKVDEVRIEGLPEPAEGVPTEVTPYNTVHGLDSCSVRVNGSSMTGRQAHNPFWSCQGLFSPTHGRIGDMSIVAPGHYNSAICYSQKSCPYWPVSYFPGVSIASHVEACKHFKLNRLASFQLH